MVCPSTFTEGENRACYPKNERSVMSTGLKVLIVLGMVVCCAFSLVCGAALFAHYYEFKAFRELEEEKNLKAYLSNKDGEDT